MDKPKGWKVGYKVVRGNNCMSACLFVKAQTRYFRSRPTYPKKGCGPLCVFTSLEDALNFASLPHHIYLCYYKPSRGTYIWWRTLEGDKDWLPLSSLSKGKALALAVQLVKRI